MITITRESLTDIIELRHTLHQNPELGYHEFQTSEIVARFLGNLPGVVVERGIAQTGVVGILNTGRPGPVVALRADMDALPLQEKTGLSYTSAIPGIMHACGHDGHTAALLGAARILCSSAASLCGKIVFLFQPAEEALGGARVVMESGILQREGVQHIFGFHGWPNEAVGNVCTAPGPFMASSNRFTLKITGKGCHGSTPHQGSDSIAAGAAMVTQLLALPSRRIDPRSSTVLSVGCFRAGEVGNIIPEVADIIGTFRTFSEQEVLLLRKAISRVVQGIAAAHECEVTCDIPEGYPVLINDQNSVTLIEECAERLECIPAVKSNYEKVLAGEDFAYYTREIAGAFWFLGLGTAIPLHSPFFDFNDEVLDKAIAMHCEIVRSINGI
jgi:amidohydrolase